MCRFSPPGCSRLCRAQRFARLGRAGPCRSPRASPLALSALGLAVGFGPRVPFCALAAPNGWRLGAARPSPGALPPPRLSALRPSLGRRGSARRPCYARGGLRRVAVPVRSLPRLSAGGVRSRWRLSRRSSGASGVAPSLSALAGAPPSAPLALAASRRCGSAALRWPCRAGSGLAVALALRAAPAPPRLGLGRWPPGAAGAATGRQCRPRRGQGQGQDQGQVKGKPLFAALGAAAPRPPVAQGGPPARRVDNPKNVDSLLDKSIQAWYSRHWKGKPPR